ncbi:hypothetical protein BHM03_00023185, partial [Ensete ventricosum]
MWRNIVRTASSASRNLRLSSNRPSPLPATTGFVGCSQDSIWCEKSRTLDPGTPLVTRIFDAGFWQKGESLPKTLGYVNSSIEVSGVPRNSRSFASVAEAVSSTDADEDTSTIEEMQRLLELSSTEISGGKEDKSFNELPPSQQFPRIKAGMGSAKYIRLRRRQIEIETEAWEKAAKEYKELLMDMCERKLAPNLPYMKSLFLGWFEPFRDKIAEEQEAPKGKNKYPYHHYFSQLPAEMMAVITMHKLVSLLMTGDGAGGVRVIHAVCQVGEAIEQEVCLSLVILNFTFSANIPASSAFHGSVFISLWQVKMEFGICHKREKKRRKISRALLFTGSPVLFVACRRFLCGEKDRGDVGSRLIELLMETAFIHPPVSQSADGPPDIRPAFRHSVRIVSNERLKQSRRFGVIECDPLVRQGLDRTALDTLGSTKWRVNKRVLSIVDRIWSSGGRLADLVDREDIPLPEKPDTEDESELRKWKWKMRSVKKENSERHSQRCDVELKLTVRSFYHCVARKMKDEEGFYYPHNLDFRGRAYPMHPYLNHLGSDLCRGILEFAEGRPLGKSGLRWLKIHLANLYAGGVDKLSYDGRLAFTENHVEDILDSADRPLDGRRWWLGAEDPFQCLAVCINLAEALQSSSPETTISHMPVHQLSEDGSCNGLQHYAALGRDRVDRKLVKQTVMTSVYGVTYIGAREQIKKRLKERGTTLTALGEMFEAARKIMTWLGDCAKVCNCFRKPYCEVDYATWTSGGSAISCCGKAFCQSNLKPLNLFLLSYGIWYSRNSCLESHFFFLNSIAGVHDSYWTHACDVDQMNRILREKFVELYEKPILENVIFFS